MKKFARLVVLAFIISLIVIPVLFSIAGATSPETYRSDPDPESTSVDGYAGSFYTTGTSWATIRSTDHSGPPALADDSGTGMNILISGTASSWTRIYHPILLFDTSALPDTAVITAVTLNIRCGSVQDDLSMSPDVVVVSSNPASNTAIAYGDYDTLGTTEYSNVISYGSFSAGNWNTFTLNSSGRAAVSKTGVTKLGLREHTHDLHNSEPSYAGASAISFVTFYSADYTGTTSDPYLTITYVIPPTVHSHGSWGIESTTAYIGGGIDSTGGEDPTVTLYYGDNDGGTTPGSWDNAVSPTSPSQPQGAATFYKYLTGLSSGTKYYWRFKATNSAGTTWSAATENFTTLPAAPTGVSATDGTYTDKVVVTWTKSTGATGYQVYRDGTGLGWIGDTNVYNDTGATAGTITAGTADATDGDSASYVTLTLSGESANNGTTHTYKVKAKNATGESADSSTNTGYRGVGSLTYQWQRSAADSDADYSNIIGATTDPYNDTSAPSGGIGRYFKCVLSATGATSQTSTSNRGYRSIGLGVDTQAASGITSSSAMLNAEITLVDSGNATTRGFVFSSSSHSEPGDVLPAASGYSLYVTESGNWGTGTYGLSTGNVLSKYTTYYARSYVQNVVGNVYGDEVSFITTITAPTVSTSSATNLSASSARINGYLTDDGGVSCDVRFQYYTGAGTWTDNETSWQPGKTTGNNFYADVSGLSPSTTYHFRAVALGNGTAYGASADFTTSSSVGNITSFTAIPRVDARAIDLRWSKPSGASEVLVRYKAGSYPASISDGTFVCQTKSNAYALTGLEAGATLYFAAWGISGNTSSSIPMNAIATVSLATAADSPGVPEQPTNWFKDVEYTNLSSMPAYEIFNNTWDAFGFSREFAWGATGMIICMLIFIVAYVFTKGQIMTACLAVLVIMGVETKMGLMAGFMVLLWCIPTAASIILRNRT